MTIRNRYWKLTAGSALALLATVALPAHAAQRGTEAAPYIVLGQVAEAPAGFLAMCERAPALCGDTAHGEAAKVPGGGADALAPSPAELGSTAAIVRSDSNRPAFIGGMAAARTRGNVSLGWLVQVDAPLAVSEEASWENKLDLLPAGKLGSRATVSSAGLAGPTAADGALAQQHFPALRLQLVFSQALQVSAKVGSEAVLTLDTPVPTWAFRTSSIAPVFAEAGSFVAGGLKDEPTTTMSLRDLKRLNRSINSRVFQREDIRTYGVEEYWTPSGGGPGAAGDCEDIALEKQIELTRLGLPAGSARLAVVYHRNLGLHVVLVVRTTRGDYVLDSATHAVKPWSGTPYQWLRMQSAANPMTWQRIV